MNNQTEHLTIFNSEMKHFLNDISTSTSKDLSDYGGILAIGSIIRIGRPLEFKNMEQFATRVSQFTKEEIQQILVALLDNEIGDIIASNLIADLYGRVEQNDFEFIVSHERLNFPF